MLHLLFWLYGFQGDSENYYDPSNSLLPFVLAERKGIPISLAILHAAVGRRAGLPIDFVGMPMHFMNKLRSQDSQEERFIDVFAGGRILDRSVCYLLPFPLFLLLAVWLPACLSACLAAVQKWLASVRLVWSQHGACCLGGLLQHFSTYLGFLYEARRLPAKLLLTDVLLIHSGRSVYEYRLYRRPYGAALPCFALPFLPYYVVH